ncbi:MAG TPA: hypothetical protein VN520_25395 [Streptomyces sp.]|uniref:hypothetical protein n=1 Tax=Streptomyces sp. TaxID=1931 RepID=UPI002BFCA3C6|nr:hypothetical protein [Streptomyces sp.]HWU09673.1 hypothetical protein [Streptomyces sp.]
MPNSHARALRTHDINEVFVQELKAREDQLRSNHVWIAPVLDQLSGGRVVTPPRYVPARFTLADQADLIDEASHVGIYRMWARRGRVTFDVNEHLAAELYRSTYKELPGRIFDHLPYINPLVVLPDPWPIRYQKSDGLVRGFFVHGYNQLPERQTYTDEDIEGLGLLFVIDLLDDDTGEVRQQTYIRLHVPTGLRQFTLKQAVGFAAARAEARWARTPEEKPVLALFEALLKPALSILVYLCCDNRDVVEPPVVKPTRKKRKRPAPRDRDPFFVEVGWRVGPRLHAARRAAGRVTEGDGVPSGVQRAPHQRAGHFHRYWTGPKRTQEVTMFVEPHWVNFHLLPEDVDPITTVVPVDPQRHDPLRRRGLRSHTGKPSKALTYAA